MLQKSNLRDVQNLRGFPPLFRGMRMLLYGEKCVRLGLMNGCECTLEEIIFADEEEIPPVVYAGSPIVLQYLPHQLLLRAVDAQWSLPASQLPTLPSSIN